MKPFIAICLTFVIGCTKTNESTKSLTVYIAGYEMNSSGMTVAKYWRNGVAVNLTSGAHTAAATAMTLSGNDVYVTGFELNGVSLADVGKFWKNGNEFNLANCAAANSIVVNGTDVYIAGMSTAGLTYWKNGNATLLCDSLLSTVSGIAVSGSDVYVSGYNQLLTNHRAGYWKNGHPTYISSKESEAYSISVDSGDVFIGGYEMSDDGLHKVATYWKNGIAVTLTSGTLNAWAKSITLSGSDVYVAGMEGEVATYWKNGTPLKLTDGSQPAEALSIALYGADVYAAGYEGGRARYWKNGLAQDFADGTANANAVSIVVR